MYTLATMVTPVVRFLDVFVFVW